MGRSSISAPRRAWPRGSSGRIRRRGRRALLPFERPLLPGVREPDEEDEDEDGHFDEAEEPELPEEDRPGIDEGRLEVEEDEQEGDEVELDRDAARRRDE